MARKMSTGTAMSIIRVKPRWPEKNTETCPVCKAERRFPCRDRKTNRLLYVTHTSRAAARRRR